MILTGLLPILGSALGLIGSVVDKFAEAKKVKAELEVVKENNRHAEVLADKEYARLEKISEIDLAKMQVTVDGEALSKSYEVFTTSMTQGQKLTGGKLWFAVVVDTFNNLVRPVSTVYYQILVGSLAAYCIYYLNTYAPDMLKSAEMQKEMLVIIFAIFDAIIFLASTSLGWWFGARGISLRGKK